MTKIPLPSIYTLLLVLVTAVLLVGCTPNNPYRSAERGKNIFYSTFDEPPKHLDPARSYSSNEYDIIAQIYEPPLQYHYLKRPYTLVPLSVESVPVPEYYDADGSRLAGNAPPEIVDRAIYEIRIKKNVMYQPHPAFARDETGAFIYSDVTDRDLKGIKEIKDFKYTGTRELRSDDFIYQIKRLADPQLHCPVLPILAKYILGLDEFASALRADLEAVRAERKLKAGATYSQTLDERANPIIQDYDKHPLAGVEKIDDHTLRIILKRKYPQFVYWLAMPFFSPIPEEAIRFYKQGPLQERNIKIDRFPIGTGPYMIETFNENMEIILQKNKNFHHEPYPSEGEPSDLVAGLLEDAGKALPFIERFVYKLEKEAIPRWNKFLQGYYDNSGITSDSFDQAITITADAGPDLTDFILEKRIRLITSVRPSTYYLGFNMLDEVVGGLGEDKRKLRQAISIALNEEEHIEIFANGRGIPAMSPLPPGIFGYTGGKEGINPYVYDWDEKRQRPVRKSLNEAKRLLGEAGYPGGRDSLGRPLVITYDNAFTGIDAAPIINWYIKKLKPLGIQLENRSTDYNRFQDKILRGDFQILTWGWNADYPDPENFMFLLYGPNGKAIHKGENASNYSSPEFDRLFTMMENMDNTPERLVLIREMIRVLQRDAPWAWGLHPVAFGLSHSWVGNLKSNPMANNKLKYIKLDPEVREEMRYAWNRPNLWPLAAVAAVLIAGSIPAVISISRRTKGKSEWRGQKDA